MDHCREDSPLLSIVTVTLDNLQGLTSTAASIERQRLPEGIVEWIVIDGGSNDGTADYLKGPEFAGRKYVTEQDSGVYDAMNKGLRLSQGKYVQFLNAGDLLVGQDGMEKVLSALVERGPAWLVTGAVHRGAGRKINNQPHIWWRHALGLQPHCHQACFFRTSTLRLIGGHPTTRGVFGDFEVVLRFGAVQPPLELAEIIVEYEGGGVSERVGHLIPQVQHEVRTAVLQLGKIGGSIDYIVYRNVAAFNQMRKRAGAMKAEAGKARRGSSWISPRADKI